MEDEKDVFHVGIQNPADMRRAVLESSKEVIYSLQRFEKIQALRTEKARLSFKLKNQIAELVQIINLLKRELPKTKLRAKESNVPKSIAPLDTSKRPNQPENEIDKLELDLKSVESKLDRLG